MISFDQFQSWQHSLEQALLTVLDAETLNELASTKFDFVETAGGFVSNAVGVELLSVTLLDWLERNEFCVYHGTRLLPSEVESVQNVGLRLLSAGDRQERLEEIFSCHNRWVEVKGNLPTVLEDVGPKKKQGRREGQVHFSLSRLVLMSDLEHYIGYGSEFDQHVAYRLFGDNSGVLLLKEKTQPYIVHVRMSGSELIKGAHPIFTYKDVVEGGEVPGLSSTFLNAWAFKRSRPDFDLANLRTDCCMMQEYPTGRDKVIRIEQLDPGC